MSGTERLALLGSPDLDSKTVLYVSCMFLDQAGFSDAWSDHVVELLQERLKIVQENGLPIEQYFRPVLNLGSFHREVLTKLGSLPESCTMTADEHLLAELHSENENLVCSFQLS